MDSCSNLKVQQKEWKHAWIRHAGIEKDRRRVQILTSSATKSSAAAWNCGDVRREKSNARAKSFHMWGESSFRRAENSLLKWVERVPLAHCLHVSPTHTHTHTPDTQSFSVISLPLVGTQPVVCKYKCLTNLSPSLTLPTSRSFRAFTQVNKHMHSHMHAPPTSFTHTHAHTQVWRRHKLLNCSTFSCMHYIWGGWRTAAHSHVCSQGCCDWLEAWEPRGGGGGWLRLVRAQTIESRRFSLLNGCCSGWSLSDTAWGKNLHPESFVPLLEC